MSPIKLVILEALAVADPNVVLARWEALGLEAIDCDALVTVPVPPEHDLWRCTPRSEGLERAQKREYAARYRGPLEQKATTRGA